MGQQANSHRNAKLDEQKARAAGRRGRTGQNAPGRKAILDAASPVPAKGQTGGVTGQSRSAQRRGG